MRGQRGKKKEQTKHTKGINTENQLVITRGRSLRDGQLVKGVNCMGTENKQRLIMVINLYCIQVSNYHIVYLKLV